jgi:ABC-type lipoprotein export system ATPase subunit
MPVSVSEVSVSFGARLVLDRVTGRFGDSEVSAVMGPSGAGKSTLLAVIAGYIRPQDGHTDTHGVPKNRIGFVAQSAPLLQKRTVLDNVALGALAVGSTYSESADRAIELLRSLSMEGLAQAKAYQISGGERQRVAILRAIAFRAPILLADEPTASLDNESRAAVFSALRVASKGGATVIVATHDPFVADMSDLVMVL